MPELRSAVMEALWAQLPKGEARYPVRLERIADVLIPLICRHVFTEIEALPRGLEPRNRALDEALAVVRETGEEQ